MVRKKADPTPFASFGVGFLLMLADGPYRDRRQIPGRWVMLERRG